MGLVQIVFSCCLPDVLQILTPFMLRRLKTDVDFVIPPKREVVVYAQLSTVQQEMYRCILNKTIAQLVKAPSETPVCCLSQWHFAVLAAAFDVGHSGRWELCYLFVFISHSL